MIVDVLREHNAPMRAYEVANVLALNCEPVEVSSVSALLSAAARKSKYTNVYRVASGLYQHSPIAMHNVPPHTNNAAASKHNPAGRAPVDRSRYVRVQGVGIVALNAAANGLLKCNQCERSFKTRDLGAHKRQSHSVLLSRE